MSSTTRTAVIIGDILVLAVTWMKTVYLYKEAIRMKVEAPLATLLLREGKSHFGAILLSIYLFSLRRDVLLHVGSNRRPFTFYKAEEAIIQ